MKKFWKVLKVFIFSVGALTLALIALIMISNITHFFRGKKQAESTAPAEEVILKKQDGGLLLAVVRRETAGSDAYLVTLTRDGADVVRNYLLPTEKRHLEYVSFNDATLISAGRNEYRIVLYSDSGEGEGDTESQVWFLKMTNAMDLREVITLSDMHALEYGGMAILGNKRFWLPYREGFPSESFVVPVMVGVAEIIRVTPLLTPEGADALHTALEREIKARMEKPSKDNEENFDEQYRKIGRDLDEALSEKVTEY